MLNTKTNKLAAAFLAMAFMAPMAPQMAAAQDTTTFLLVSENAHEGTVPAGHRIFRRVYDAVEDQLSTRGFQVFDETSLSLDIPLPGARRNRAQILQRARLYTGAPIDVVFIFEIYASAQELAHDKSIMVPQIRISGRFIEVRTGRALGNFESENYRDEPIPAPCDKNCILEYFGGKSKVIARNVASAMAIKMQSLIDSGSRSGGGSSVTGGGSGSASGNDCGGRPTAFTLVFDNFDSSEITQVEEYLAAFKCYDHHRPVGATSETHHEYWYETTGDHARLNRNIRIMLEAMRVKAQINSTARGFVINKISTF